MDSAHQSDIESLITRAKGGDDSALGQLLETYRRYLGILAELQLRGRLGSKLDGSDIVQDTFVRAAASFEQFRGSSEREVATWLRRILSHALADQMRRYLRDKQRDVRLELSLEAQLNHSSQTLRQSLATLDESPSDLASRKEGAVRLAEALGQLGDADREVIMMRNIEGLSFPEIAKLTGKSVDSVKNRWLRALPRLKDALGDDSG